MARPDATRPSSHARRQGLGSPEAIGTYAPTSCLRLRNSASRILCFFPLLLAVVVIPLLLLLRLDRLGLATTLFICTLHKLSPGGRGASSKDQTARYRLIGFINYKMGTPGRATGGF